MRNESKLACMKEERECVCERRKADKPGKLSLRWDLYV